MGAYLSKPNTEKLSQDIRGNNLEVGVSEMQGWRVSQEDSHNCILDFEENGSLFGVYDGHGGAEVAIYCSQNLPQYIKNQNTYKKEDYKQALIDAFMEFDSCLTKESVIEELKQLVGLDDTDDDQIEGDESELLSREAMMPITELIAKYSQGILDMKALKKKGAGSDFLSPVINKAKSKMAAACSSSSGDGEEASPEEAAADPAKSLTNGQEEEPGQVTSSTSAGTNGDSEPPAVAPAVHSNGEVTSSSGSEKEANAVKEKVNGKGKVSADKENGPVDGEEEEEEDDEEEVEGGFFEDDESDDEEDDDSQEEEEDDDEDEEEGAGFPMASEKEEPGSESGCTAVVALLRGRELIVANAGDSRCVVSRGGRAVDMSEDHKPQDEPEQARIEKAGGKVTQDGRVNGGLNLSRALGDHTYKQNSDLEAKEQMITAYPDIKSLTLEDQDDFMVLACDGIWNVFSSQEVISFVRERINDEDEKIRPLSSICEELFEVCLAEDTSGDGTGCDNMTCIIVRFNSDLAAEGNKRRNSNDSTTDDHSSEQASSKKPKVSSSPPPATSKE